MLQNNGEHIVSQINRQKLMIGFWEWTDVLKALIYSIPLYVLFSRVFPKSKLIIIVYLVVFFALIYYEIPDINASIATVFKKKLKYVISNKTTYYVQKKRK